MYHRYSSNKKIGGAREASCSRYPKSSKVISDKVGGYGLGEIPAQASKYDLDFKQSNLTVVLKYFNIFEVYVYF